jgi:L,D-transpeptidase YcbB
MSYRRYVTAAAIALMSVGNGSSLDSAVRLAGPSQALGVAIRAIVETAPGPVAARAQLIALYSVGQYAPLWLDPSGRPTNDAQSAIRVLGAASTEGLDPCDYSALALQQSAAALTSPNAASIRDVASFDVALSRNLRRYVYHLKFGQVEPGTVGFWLPPREPDDLAARLRGALTEHTVGAFVDELSPSIPLYRRLRAALITYRKLATDPTLRPFQLPETSVRPGDRCDVVPQLRRLLVVLGDLPADDINSSELVYQGSLIDGIKHFQLRHGLEADGVIGKSTGAALRVPLPWRVRQIELAMERLRWLPSLGAERLIAVNIPMFRVWGLEGLDREYRPSFGADVIVGRALNTRTPVLIEDLEYIIFRPYWNIPTSILRGEILPAIGRTPDYLQRHHMEIVAGQSDDSAVVPITSATLDRLRQGTLRVRQRPGADNALGLVKFVFPNDGNVYMHGTPAPELFKRARRDFSHGCIRVADPVGLAEWALAAKPDWNRDRIVAAMHASGSTRVTLDRPIRVFLFYLTAAVLPEEDTMYFAEDLYGHDARLDGYLRAAGS